MMNRQLVRNREVDQMCPASYEFLAFRRVIYDVDISGSRVAFVATPTLFVPFSLPSVSETDMYICTQLK